MSVLLTPEQQLEAQQIAQQLQQQAPQWIQQIAELLASKSEAQFFGKTEFELRDLMHEFGAKALQSARQERKKRGIKVPVSPAPVVTDSLVSNDTKPGKRKRSWG